MEGTGGGEGTWTGMCNEKAEIEAKIDLSLT